MAEARQFLRLLFSLVREKKEGHHAELATGDDHAKSALGKVLRRELVSSYVESHIRIGGTP